MRTNDLIGINLHDVFNGLISILRHKGNNDPTFMTRHNVSKASNFDHDDIPDDLSIIDPGEVPPMTQLLSPMVISSMIWSSSLAVMLEIIQLYITTLRLLSHTALKKFYHFIKFWSLIFVIIIILLVSSTVLYYIIFPPNLDIEDLTSNINSFSTINTPMPFNIW